MKISKKRQCAKKAKKEIDNIYADEERDQSGEESESMLKPSPDDRKSNKFTSSDKYAEENIHVSRTVMSCTSCFRPMFHYGGQESQVCQCHPNFSYGCFWQEPHKHKKNVLNTFVLYRANNKSVGKKYKSWKGEDSAVEMTVQLPDRKVKFFHDLNEQ